MSADSARTHLPASQ
ncbi:uncharacterized protein ARMOST_02041 [Armillaria ostoyae]|uniref:Uncharacterized protein n=1 Tax=Armillaria ostoyae TaxID=47428 RepID=A0A284QQL4_ARMOS|nr:uncharacterized protein ARMOST_02041 [Armillaria ostoyae]